MNLTPAPLNLLVRHIFVLLWALFAVVPSAQADIGSDWLAAQFQADGSLATSGDLATPYQATTETMLLWQALGETSRPVIPAALQFLDNERYHGTEYLSRLILVKKGA
ncbi:MAG: hypothetical protein ACU837_08290 [Gammaproteobacteria bacterium]